MFFGCCSFLPYPLNLYINFLYAHSLYGATYLLWYILLFQLSPHITVALDSLSSVETRSVLFTDATWGVTHKICICVRIYFLLFSDLFLSFFLKNKKQDQRGIIPSHTFASYILASQTLKRILCGFFFSL